MSPAGPGELRLGFSRREILDAGAGGFLSGFLNDLRGRFKLSNRRTEQEDEILFGGLTAFDQGRQTGMVRVRKELSPFLPQSR
jgi:hypothetical protein